MAAAIPAVALVRVPGDGGIGVFFIFESLKALRIRSYKWERVITSNRIMREDFVTASAQNRGQLANNQGLVATRCTPLQTNDQR